MTKSALFVGASGREDIDYFPKILSADYRILSTNTCLEFETLSRRAQKLYHAIDVLSYRGYFDLLKKESVRLVIFLSLENYHEVALNAAAHQLGIKTIFVNHGVKDLKASILVEGWRLRNRADASSERQSPMKRVKLFGRKARMRWHLILTKEQLDMDARKELIRFMEFRKSNAIHDTLREFNGSIHFPSLYLCFSRTLFEFQRNTHYPDRQIVKYIGNPSFDFAFSLKVNQDGRKIYFIDQPFANSGLFGWTEKKYRKLISALASLSKAKTGYPLFVKPHPLSDSGRWSTLEPEVELVEKQEFTSNGIYIGFGSTLLIPLAGLSDSVVVSLEMHPNIDFNYAEFLTSSGAIAVVRSLNELEEILDEPEKFNARQGPAKEGLLAAWTSDSTGNSAARIKTLISAL